MADLKDRVLKLLELRNLSQAEAGRRSGFKNAAFINDIVRGHKTDVRGQNLSRTVSRPRNQRGLPHGSHRRPRCAQIAADRFLRPRHLRSGRTLRDERGSGVDVRASWPDDAIAELVAEGGLGTGQVIASLEAGNMKTVDEVKDEYWKFPSSFVRGTLNTTPLKMLVVECTGDSMEPTLHSGDRVWVNTGHVRPTPDGLYAIRDAFGAVIVKRLEIAQERPIRLRIISDNTKHHPREVDEHDITIVGKVVAGLRLF